jgi:CHAT domain-containing protein
MAALLGRSSLRSIQWIRLARRFLAPCPVRSQTEPGRAVARVWFTGAVMAAMILASGTTPAHSDAAADSTATFDAVERDHLNALGAWYKRSREDDIPPRALGIDALRERLDGSTAVLVYHLGGSESRMWAITKAGASTYRLPPRVEIEAMEDTLLSELGRADRAASPLALHAGRRLYMMLVASAESVIRSKQSLVIVPDGPLALLPFETLLTMEPTQHGEPPRGGYVIERYDVSYALAASVAAPWPTTDKHGGIVALGDPYFPRASGDRGGPELAPLPGTAAELAALDLQSRGREISVLAGKEASRARLFTDPLLADAQVLHLATHAVAFDADPDRSGLWLASDDGSGPGYLSVDDILRLDLRASLVTLSACETNLETSGGGRGLRALESAFAAAGAERVMISLWKVNDRTTAALLERFYRERLRKQRSAAAALALAKRQMIRKPETRSPYKWAMFVVVQGRAPAE